MTRRRWIADEVSGNHAAITGAHADHLVRVLRARVGQEFDISAENAVRRGRIITIAEERVEFELGAEIPVPACANVTLLLAVFKFDRMEWAIEKCTELGISRIIPTITRRTDSHLAAASGKRVERWRRIAREASEQSRRVSAAEISAPVNLGEAMCESNGLHIVLSESEDQVPLPDVLAAHSARAIALAIGPEGGWTEDELQSFQAAGWISASLGRTILRAETAAIAATAVVFSQLL